MAFTDATAYGTLLAKKDSKTYWVYRINGRGGKFQITGTYGMATNGKVLTQDQIVAVCEG